MTSRACRWTGVLAALAVGLFPPFSLAEPGSGIRIGGGDGKLSPYLEVETRWDSNALYSPTLPTSALILHVRPGLTFDSPGENVAFKGSADLDWAQYLSGTDTSGLSRLFADAALGVGLNRRGTLGLEFDDTFQRSASTSEVVFQSALIQNTNTLDLSIPWRPGGGALSVIPMGTWRLSSFEPYVGCTPGTASNCTSVTGLGYNELSGGLGLKWRFLPRTAVVVDASATKRSPNDTTQSREVNGWRADMGLEGLISTHIATTLKLGYGSATSLAGMEETIVNGSPVIIQGQPETQPYASGSFHTWLANAEITWLPTFTSSARLGYTHDWGSDPGIPFGLFEEHRLYLDGKKLIGGRLSAVISGQFEYLTYKITSGWSDIVRISPGFNYEILRWLAAGVGYAYTSRNVVGVTNLPTSGYTYSKNEVWLNLRGTY